MKKIFIFLFSIFMSQIAVSHSATFKEAAVACSQCNMAMCATLQAHFTGLCSQNKGKDCEALQAVNSIISNCNTMNQMQMMQMMQNQYQAPYQGYNRNHVQETQNFLRQQCEQYGGVWTGNFCYHAPQY